MQPVGEFTRIDLAADIGLHLHRLPLFKTVRVDFCISEKLCPGRNTRLALISRLLERGTRTLPDLQSLNRFIDDLYGAHYYAEAERMGDFNYIHLCLEVADQQYLGAGAPDVLAHGMAFLNEILSAPAGDGVSFREDYLAQEKRVLSEIIADRFNDKIAYARRRCIEEMCRGEAIALSPLGDVADFPAIDGRALLHFQREILAANRLDVFISGDIDQEQARNLAVQLINWQRDPGPTAGAEPVLHHRPTERQVFEYREVQQATLVAGYRTGVMYGDEDYPALVLLNLLLGGEGTSRLFKSLREEAGLCYYVASHIEPLSGLLFVVAGIGAEAYGRALDGIERELDILRQGRVDSGEIAAARKLLRAYLLGIGEDRDAHFSYRLRSALVGIDEMPEAMWAAVEYVGGEDLARVARGLESDTVYMLHGGMRAEVAV